MDLGDLKYMVEQGHLKTKKEYIFSLILKLIRSHQSEFKTGEICLNVSQLEVVQQ